MASYIIKKEKITKAKVSYEKGNDSYTFAPKGSKYSNIKVTVVDKTLKDKILQKKLASDYKKIVAQIYNILANASDEDDSSNVLVAYTELQRLKQIFIFRHEQKVSQKLLEHYLKKISILEMEINKLLVNLYQKNIKNEEYEERKGVRR